jgi:hypothetical protein
LIKTLKLCKKALILAGAAVEEEIVDSSFHHAFSIFDAG